jgi:hypothetical protein
MELEWIVVVAVAKTPWPWPWIKLLKFSVRAVRPEEAEGAACRLALAEGYQVVNALWASCSLPLDNDTRN